MLTVHLHCAMLTRFKLLTRGSSRNFLGGIAKGVVNRGAEEARAPPDFLKIMLYFLSYGRQKETRFCWSYVELVIFRMALR